MLVGHPVRDEAVPWGGESSSVGISCRAGVLCYNVSLHQLLTSLDSIFVRRGPASDVPGVVLSCPP